MLMVHKAHLFIGKDRLIINCNVKEIICYFLREEAENSLAMVILECPSGVTNLVQF